VTDRTGHSDSWAVTRLHNAMTIIEIDDAKILTDPWFVNSRAFRGHAPITVEELPELTAIIGSHWVRDHWEMRKMRAYPHKDTPMYVSAPNMEKSARKHGFTNVEVLEWGAQRALTDTVTLHAIEEHSGHGRRSNNYGIFGSKGRIFFGGEVLDLGAIRRYGEANAPFDVAIGPVNGVFLISRQLTVTAPEMLEAARLLKAPKLLTVHDEHKALGPMLKVTSSIRDLDTVDHDDVEIIELDLGGRYVARAVA
jgi:L-ascorbate metabolism protein UlaG (beta-lactamase superfamily)